MCLLTSWSAEHKYLELEQPTKKPGPLPPATYGGIMASDGRTPCTHDVTEREVAAVADALCPLCLQRELAQCQQELAEARELLRWHSDADLQKATDAFLTKRSGT